MIMPDEPTADPSAYVPELMRAVNHLGQLIVLAHAHERVGQDRATGRSSSFRMPVPEADERRDGYAAAILKALDLIRETDDRIRQFERLPAVERIRRESVKLRTPYFLLNRWHPSAMLAIEGLARHTADLCVYHLGRLRQADRMRRGETEEGEEDDGLPAHDAEEGATGWREVQEQAVTNLKHALDASVHGVVRPTSCGLPRKGPPAWLDQWNHSLRPQYLERVSHLMALFQGELSLSDYDAGTRVTATQAQDATSTSVQPPDDPDARAGLTFKPDPTDTNVLRTIAGSPVSFDVTSLAAAMIADRGSIGQRVRVLVSENYLRRDTMKSAIYLTDKGRAFLSLTVRG